MKKYFSSYTYYTTILLSTDHCLEECLSINPLTNLKRFILTDACNSQTVNNGDANNFNSIGHPTTRITDESRPNLSSISILRLFGQCSKLRCVGDLRHWCLFQDEKKDEDICKKIAAIHGGHWLLNTFEP